MENTDQLRESIWQFLGRCPERSASFQEVIDEFYAENPTGIADITREIYELIDEGRAAKFVALFAGELQNHVRRVN